MPLPAASATSVGVQDAAVEVLDLSQSLPDLLEALLLGKEKHHPAPAQEPGRQQVVLLVCGGFTLRIPQASKLVQSQF